MEIVKSFFQKKDVVLSLQRYGIDALGAMAQGLFCTLLVGTILNTLGQQFQLDFLTRTIVTIGSGESGISYSIGGLASAMVGPGIAIAIGFALHCPPLVLFSLIPVGFAANALGGAGGPLAVYFVAIAAAESGKLISKETKIDILVTPVFTVLVGIGAAALIAAPIGSAAARIGDFVRWATVLQPFLMGILVSVIVGIALTLPISSAAICAALGLTGLAGGAAVAGCCAQMVGFAVMSFQENRWGGLVAQGLGTSMLQMPNIVKNPRIWIPPILVSAITGPLSTCLFRLEMNGTAVSSGMGTCGFVGQIGIYTGWVNDIVAGTKSTITTWDWLGMLLICFILPAVLSCLFCRILRKWGWIREDDLKLSL
ncbi:MAG: PTS sugar transporter subunit IIC [Oscillospiraceae bacterium]|nr:PTS sugar transporter subunit IIC [Oscillospiraceae bacterium]